MKAVIAIGLALLALPAWAEDCTPTPRMPVEQSQAIKRSMLPPGGEMRDFELDHIRPLALGGSNDRSNLQLQPWPEAKRKDALELRLIQAVRQGQVGCAEAVKTIEAWRP